MENNKKAFYLGLANLVAFIIFLYIHYTTYSVRFPEFMDQLSKDSSFFLPPLLAFVLHLDLLALLSTIFSSKELERFNTESWETVLFLLELF